MTENTLIYPNLPTSSDLVRPRLILRGRRTLDLVHVSPHPGYAGETAGRGRGRVHDDQPKPICRPSTLDEVNRNALNYPLPDPREPWLNPRQLDTPRRIGRPGALGMNDWDPAKARRRARKLLELLSHNRRELITLRRHWKAQYDNPSQRQYWSMRIDIELDERIRLLIAWRLAVRESEGV